MVSGEGIGGQLQVGRQQIPTALPLQVRPIGSLHLEILRQQPAPEIDFGESSRRRAGEGGTAMKGERQWFLISQRWQSSLPFAEICSCERNLEGGASG